MLHISWSIWPHRTHPVHPMFTLMTPRRTWSCWRCVGAIVPHFMGTSWHIFDQCWWYWAPCWARVATFGAILGNVHYVGPVLSTMLDLCWVHIERYRKIVFQEASKTGGSANDNFVPPIVYGIRKNMPPYLRVLADLMLWSGPRIQLGW